MRRALLGSRAQKQCCPPERNRSTEPRPGCPQETPSPWTSVCLGRFEKRPAPAIALCTPCPARSCSGSSRQLSRISQGLCLCGTQPYSPRMCSQQLLEAASPAWPAHQQLLSPQATALGKGLQFQEQPQPRHRCVAEAECTQVPRAPQPPKTGLWTRKALQGHTYGVNAGACASIGPGTSYSVNSLEKGIFIKINCLNHSHRVSPSFTHPHRV